MSRERVVDVNVKPIFSNNLPRVEKTSKLYIYRYDTKYMLEIQVDTEKDDSKTITTWASMEGKFTKVRLMSEKSHDLKREMSTLIKKSFDKMEEMYETVEKWYSI